MGEIMKVMGGSFRRIIRLLVKRVELVVCVSIDVLRFNLLTSCFEIVECYIKTMLAKVW